MERGTGSNKEQLQQSEERFKLLVECIRDYAIFMLDPDGVVLTWNAGATPSARQTLQLGLTNVAAASLESVRAKLKCATITATTDGATALTLLELRPGSAISENGAPLGSVPASGTATIDLSAGTTTLGVCSAST